ncbi:23S rRNA pseudouridine1911/1915/1917 synthase [Peribacillus deserti]|uniref:Pseudouridine synthase n=1 Tax=Peribacillus deserti TaxID=673318 RepID=A0ABS2QND1_9BACI|nr:RluA family pseudouridine synthase [Peribacillus deserti]MBM7694259.1 23S rRNA pseudouridine1911/1915/1917 synthase [Peribacillus deserti]
MIKTEKKGSSLHIWVPEKWAGYSVEQVFTEYWRVPKKMAHEWRMGKKVVLRGRPAVWSEILQKGDLLQVPLLYAEEKERETYMDIQVLYEDDHVIVVNKKAGVQTHPSQPEETDSLVNGVAFYMLSNGESQFPFHIHRLDKDTTGAILFAKDRLSAAILDRDLQERKIKRTYIALVHGLIKNKKGTINEKIGKDRHHGSRRRVSPTGQDAVTHYEVIQVLPDKNQTLVKCRLDTGRTHQIRVHLSYVGHPLVGDLLYGGQPVVSRQALHACKLEFTHPITEENIEISAPFLDHPAIFTM